MKEEIFADAREIALHDLIGVYAEAAMRFAYMASIIDDPGLAEKFQQMAGQKQEQVSELARQVRSMGYLVKDIDEERELLEEVLIKLKSFIAADKKQMLIQELLREEKMCRQKIDAALDQGLPPQFAALLENYRTALGRELRELIG
jgi:uncharacterized protein (TIGR02284 family)